MAGVLNGISVALFAVAGLIFLKFWTATRDRLFLLFALAFAVLAINRAMLSVLPYFAERTTEFEMVIYLVRLFAFILILVAIIDKNRRSPIHISAPPVV